MDQQKSSYDLESISLSIVENIDELLDEFDISYVRFSNRITASCPIHFGDNPEGFGILTSGIGNWNCYTNGCHEKYNNSIISLVRQLLEVRDGRDYSFNETLKWVSGFLNIKLETVKVDKTRKTVFDFSTKSESTKQNKLIPIEYIKSSLKQTDYYIKRNFTSEVLEKYHVGLCDNPAKEMHNRVVIPFIDDSGKFAVGCQGRTILDKCNICEYYHEDLCPQTRFEKLKYTKWKFSKGFVAEDYLYNFHSAKDYINKNKVAILVEGPGDVWKLEESDIHNGVAVLGTKFTDKQFEKLASLGVLTLILAFDFDTPGKEFTERMIDEYSRLLTLYRVDLPEKDLGEMSIEQTKQLFRFLGDL